jgi:hypothetical protein
MTHDIGFVLAEQSRIKFLSSCEVALSFQAETFEDLDTGRVGESMCEQLQLILFYKLTLSASS